jgi:Ulp1 family protease
MTSDYKIHIIDSLGSYNFEIEQSIIKWIKHTYHNASLKSIYNEIIQQKNSYNCGMHVYSTTYRINQAIQQNTSIKEAIRNSPTKDEISTLRDHLKNDIISANTPQAKKVVAKGDHNKLSGKQWLNDTILNYLMKETIQPEQDLKIINIYFYKLTIKQMAKGKIRNKYLLIPINIDNCH